VAAAHETAGDSWRAEYHRLFEGAIGCPVNEAAYVRRDKGMLLADIVGFYLAFGLSSAPAKGERPDHLRCELEFLAVLFVMLARAEEGGAEEDRKVTLAAMRGFMADHLGEWLGPFCARLEATSTVGLYGRLAAFIEAGCRRDGTAAGCAGPERSVETPLPVVRGRRSPCSADWALSPSPRRARSARRDADWGASIGRPAHSLRREPPKSGVAVGMMVSAPTRGGARNSDLSRGRSGREPGEAPVRIGRHKTLRERTYG
jgi:nitrate reductase assembly molybdenum cofactor insertion protein NarJ